jgi:hypothetical protein
VEAHSVIFIRNKRDALFTAIVSTVVTVFSGLWIWKEIKLPLTSETALWLTVPLLFLVICIIAWQRFFRRQILILINDNGLKLGKRKLIHWSDIEKYYITETVSDLTTRFLFIKLKSSEKKVKFYIAESDVPIEELIDSIQVYAMRFGFTYLGVNGK